MDDRSTEERIALWLETEAAGQVRDDVLAATFATTRSMRRRARPSGWRSIPMTRFVPAIAVGAAAIVIVGVLALNVLPGGSPSGVGGSGQPTSPTPAPTSAPTATPTPSAVSGVDVTGWRPFTSDRYGYSISYPADWTSSPSTRAWSFDKDRKDWQSTSADQFVGPDKLLTVFAAPIQAGTTPDAWIASYFGPASPITPRQCSSLPVDSRGVMADGYAARLWAEPDNGDCGATYAFVPVGDRMYAFIVWRPAQEPLLKAYLSTVRFSDRGASPSPS